MGRAWFGDGGGGQSGKKLKVNLNVCLRPFMGFTMSGGAYPPHIPPHAPAQTSCTSGLLIRTITLQGINTMYGIYVVDGSFRVKLCIQNA